jgi:hypothetical protein
MCNPAIHYTCLHAVVSGLLLKNVVGFSLMEGLNLPREKLSQKINAALTTTLLLTNYEKRGS